MCIRNSGYLDYDSLIDAFGHNMHVMQRPQIRCLHCKDPRSVSSYVKNYEKLTIQYKLHEKVVTLEASSLYPLSQELQDQYEQLDSIRCNITRASKK
jgi:hypothetical protein